MAGAAPTGRTRTYLGIDVYEGVYEHLGRKAVPGWGGSMFEALMPDMFVPEERWSPHAWGPNHHNTVAIQRKHGLEEAGYGFWGFSPSSQPGGGYREYGVDAIGLNPEGYFSDVEKTNFDKGFGPYRAGANPTPTTATAWSPRTPCSWPCTTSRGRRTTTWSSSPGRTRRTARRLL